MAASPPTSAGRSEERLPLSHLAPVPARMSQLPPHAHSATHVLSYARKLHTPSKPPLSPTPNTPRPDTHAHTHAHTHAARHDTNRDAISTATRITHEKETLYEKANTIEGYNAVGITRNKRTHRLSNRRPQKHHARTRKGERTRAATKKARTPSSLSPIFDQKPHRSALLLLLLLLLPLLLLLAATAAAAATCCCRHLLLLL